MDAVCGWFEEMGLGIYEDDLKKWLKNGAADLINVTPLDIEKEINLKSSLHRKKIVLALMDATGKETDEVSINAGKLNTTWVGCILFQSNCEHYYNLMLSCLGYAMVR